MPVCLSVRTPIDTVLWLGSLAENAICGLDYEGRVRGTYTVAGFNILCKNLKGSAVTSLKCAAPEQCSLLCQRTLTLLSFPFDSLDSNQLCGLYEDDAGSI